MTSAARSESRVASLNAPAVRPVARGQRGSASPWMSSRVERARATNRPGAPSRTASKRSRTACVSTSNSAGPFL
uniref:Uncharacterized protein n=1 Tax=uncultured marine virus TaxID=186617 RepID=A0A0F7L6M2_9VIRU|nr:hypothetical protein [uncultured marine virus]